jgi:hypothetical protein
VPTLLTNPKMDPALAARIESSLKRRAGHAGGDIYRPKWVAIARVLGVILVVGTIVQIYRMQKAARDRFEARRTTLLDAADEYRLSPSELEMLPRAESALKQLATAYEGDFVSPDLRVSGAFDALLGKPIVYVSGLVSDFAGTRAVAIGTQESTKDAFLYCLFDSPSARDEKSLHAKVLAQPSLSMLDQRTPNVTLLRDAEGGIPLLLPNWLDRVKKAKSGIELAQLELTFAKSPIAKAKRAAGARYLLAALDEGIGPSAFEGDRPHDTRILLFDLASSQPTFRLRKHVDPSFISAAHRRKYSVEMDQCAVAYDVRASASP